MEIFRFTQQISGSFNFQNGNFFPEKWKPYMEPYLFYSILREFISCIFTHNWMIMGLKSFLFVSRQINNIIGRKAGFPFYFADFNKKNRTFVWNLNWIDLYIRPTVLCYQLEYYVFCCDLKFFASCRFKFKIFHH